MTSPGRDFTLDRFQLEAIEHLDAGRSVLVAAPTGSGKTVVAEHAIDRALSERRRAFYTAPIKALSNQKYRDLSGRIGSSRVGLLTGDNAINADADIVVMTTEVLRNMLYEGRALDDLAFVIMDEVHNLIRTKTQYAEQLERLRSHHLRLHAGVVFAFVNPSEAFWRLGSSEAWRYGGMEAKCTVAWV